MIDPSQSRGSRAAAPLGLDTAVCSVIALATGVLAWMLASPLTFTLTNLDVWFDTDSLFIFDVMTNRYSPHHDRNNLHPLFGLATYPLTFLQVRLLGVDTYHAARVLLALSAALWTGLMYLTLRLMQRPVGTSLILTGIGLASTAGVLFVGIFERHLAGSITILACVAAFVAFERRALSATWLTLAAAGTMAVTITNFMIGFAALLLALGPRKGLQASANAFLLVIVLSAPATVLFPRATAFLDVRWLPYDSTLMSLGGTLADKTLAFWSHAVVIPQPTVETKPPPHEDIRYLSLQRVGLASHRPSGYAALALWLFLLGMGVWKVYQKRPFDKIDALLGFGVLGHFALFLFFGSETILYAPSYVPLMLLSISRTLSSLWLRIVAVAFLGLLTWNNARWLVDSLTLARSLL